MTTSGGIAVDPYGLRAQDLAYCQLFYGPFQDTKGRTRVTGITQDANTAVILSFGQSKSDNSVGSDTYTRVNATNYNLSIMDGQIYLSGGSLLGNAIAQPHSVYGQSYMMRIADKIITAGTKTKVILVPFAVGSTYVSDWATGGKFQDRYRMVARRLADAGLTATHAVWDQGEGDTISGLTAAQYTAKIQDIRGLLNGVGITAPLYVAVTSWDGFATYTSVRTGQANAVNGTTILSGPDLDTLTSSTYRTPGNPHFNPTGSDAVAGLWKTSLGL